MHKLWLSAYLQAWRRPSNQRTLALALAIVCAAGCEQQDHLNLASPWFALQPSELALHSTWSGWDEIGQERVTRRAIAAKSIEMISQAKTVIVASVFLFDNFYSEEPPDWDVVKALTDAIIARKRRYPHLVVAITLDPSNRAYSRRVAPAVAALSAAGVDVFYSDLLVTRAHTPFKLVESLHHGARSLSQRSGGLLANLTKPVLSRLPIPFVTPFDGYSANAQMALNAGLIKANHRKVLVVDREGGFEALVSSANPHNASVNSTNYAISVGGPLAHYIYRAQRQEIAHSIHLADSDYALWHEGSSSDYRRNYLASTLPQADMPRPASNEPGNGRLSPIRARFLTETAIKPQLIKMLSEVSADDQVRVQMFYLSDIDVINALLHAASKTRAPLRLLLDPNNDAFGRTKDGTPNRQVAALLAGRLTPAERGKLKPLFPRFIQDEGMPEPNITLRWFDTHGEQNHAKICSISNARRGTYLLMHGSANWTGKNLNGTNMEANLLIDGAQQLTEQFNRRFDRFYYNAPLQRWREAAVAQMTAGSQQTEPRGLRFSVPYSDARYHQHTGMDKWLRGERYGFVSW